jgi:two-component system chemotaxis response regulator CheB
VTFLEKLMAHHPVRTVIISSLTARGSETALRTLKANAIDIVAKPAIDVTKNMETLGQEIVDKVKMAAGANLGGPRKKEKSAAVVQKKPVSALAKTTHSILAIASSTGGTEALKTMLPMLPSDIPGTVIVQHMPPVFTKTFAESLNKLCSFEVREAADGDRVMPGLVLLAPGNFHMELSRSGAYYYVKLHQEPPLHGVRPAADFLLRSVAKVAGANAVGVVLTGMGKDGAQGFLEMKNAGAYNIAQDEATCVVFGMPKVAIDAGAIDRVLPLERIAAEITRQMKVLEVA